MNYDLVIFKVTVFFKYFSNQRIVIMIEYDIRNVLEDDFKQLVDVAENCKPITNMTPSVYHLFTRYFPNTSFVIEDRSNNDIIGFLLGFISQENPKESYIHLLCLDHCLRGNGVAKLLVDKFIDAVSTRGCNKVSLVTKPHNKISIKFYTKLGFESSRTDKTVEIDGINVYKDYDGLGDDKIIFIKQI
jgi:ribosomal protein S18 acetylase RimI-like enzyme